MVAVNDGHGTFAVDEDTDVALLDQHLLKTNALTKRMTMILSRLDSRLSRMDKTIAPLGIRDMARLQGNIDAALAQLDPSLGPDSGSAGPSTAGLSSARPQATRQGSYASANGHSHGHGHVTRQPSISSLPGSIPPVSTKEPPPTASVSVMERTRAIARTDIAPRFTDSPSNRKSHPGRAPSIRAPSALGTRNDHVESPGSMRSPLPVVGGSGVSIDATSPITGPGGDRAILERGVDHMAPGEFFGAMHNVIQDIEQMHRGIAEGRGGGREAGVSELSSLLESSLAQAVDTLLTTVKDTLPRTFDPGQYASTTPPTSTYYPPYTTIRPLSAPLAGFMYPDLPTPRSAPIISHVMDKCIRDMAQIRTEWLRKSFAPLAQRAEEADGTAWEGRGGEKVRLSIKLWDTFLTVAECEAHLAEAILPGPAGKQLAELTLASPLSTIRSTMDHVLAGIKRNLSAQNMTMLDLYASLVILQPRYEAAMANSLPDAKELQGALAGQVNTLRGLALRSFPERLVDIRTSAPRGGLTTAVSDTTFSTLAYLETLPSFGILIENLLRSSGHVERAWLMGASAPPSTVKSAAVEGGLVNLYAADVLGTLLTQLETQAKQMRRPIGATFLLNNISHIRNTIMGFKDDIIGPGAEDMLNRHLREAKEKYATEWKVLPQALQHTAQSRFPGTSSDKQSTKEAAAAFFERLAEFEQTCRQFPLNRQDPEMRERVSREVESLVTNAYRPFYTKAHGKHDKYLRGTPDDVARRVRAVFR